MYMLALKVYLCVLVLLEKYKTKSFCNLSQAITEIGNLPIAETFAEEN